VFLRKLKTSGLGLRTAAFETQSEVASLASSAGYDQVPGVYSQIIGEDVFLSGRKTEAAAASPSDAQLAGYGAAIQAGTTAALDAFLAKYPNSPLTEHARRERERLLRSQTARLDPPSLPPPVPVQNPVALTPPEEPAAPARVQPIWRLPEHKWIVAQDLCNQTFHSVAISPDGRFVLAGSNGHTLSLWDIASGRQVRRFAGHTDYVSSIAFSPDGRFALSGAGDDDKTMRLWDVSSGQEVRRFTGHERAVGSVAFSPDGRFALSGSWDGTVRLWDIASGKQIRRFSGRANTVRSVAFSPDGRFALSGHEGGLDNTLRLWDVTSGKQIRHFAEKGSVKDAALSPDGQLALSSDDDFDQSSRQWSYHLRLWDVTTGRQIREFENPGLPSSVAFSPDGRFALSGDSGSLGVGVRLWDVATGKTVKFLEETGWSQDQVAFSRDGRFVVSGKYYMQVSDVETGGVRVNFTNKEPCDKDSSEGWAAFTSDGLFVAEGDVTKILKIQGFVSEPDYPMDEFIAKNRRDSLADILSAAK
jgi:WD40 repeat protein